VYKLDETTNELPVEIRVDAANESPIHHSCVTVVAPEKTPGVQDTDTDVVLATVGKPLITGDDVAIGFVG
jgi:hypothetical protein